MSDTLEIEARGRKFPVEVEVSGDGQRGSFVADFDGNRLRYDTWDALYRGLMEATRKAAVKLNIEITVHDGQNTLDGIVYAVHGSTGSPMVEWANGGGKEQLDGFSGRRGRVVLRRLTQEEQNRLRALLAARRATAEAVSDFERDHSIDLRRSIEAGTSAS